MKEGAVSGAGIVVNPDVDAMLYDEYQRHSCWSGFAD